MMMMTITTMMMAQRQRLLQHISEHVTKFLAPQDDLGSHRQLVNDNLNSLPDHKPNTRLHTLGIYFAHMIALKKVSDYTAAAAAATSNAVGDPPVSDFTAVVACPSSADPTAAAVVAASNGGRGSRPSDKRPPSGKGGGRGFRLSGPRSGLNTGWWYGWWYVLYVQYG